MVKQMLVDRKCRIPNFFRLHIFRMDNDGYVTSCVCSLMILILIIIINLTEDGFQFAHKIKRIEFNRIASSAKFAASARCSLLFFCV